MTYVPGSGVDTTLNIWKTSTMLMNLPTFQRKAMAWDQFRIVGVNAAFRFGDNVNNIGNVVFGLTMDRDGGELACQNVLTAVQQGPSVLPKRVQVDYTYGTMVGNSTFTKSIPGGTTKQTRLQKSVYPSSLIEKATYMSTGFVNVLPLDDETKVKAFSVSTRPNFGTPAAFDPSFQVKAISSNGAPVQVGINVPYIVSMKVTVHFRGSTNKPHISVLQ